jgi:transcriptional regulator with XRE-family HTH domain
MGQNHSIRIGAPRDNYLQGKRHVAPPWYVRHMTASFGPLLKTWRERRRFSQLDLAHVADVSARHISFMEQGRAHPSRAMVLRLTRHLDVPLAERNTMLTAAGFSSHFKARPARGPELAPVHAAIERLLARHLPYPAFALDRHWRVVHANATASALFSAFALAPDQPLFTLLIDTAHAAAFENLAELRRHMAQRLKTESAHLGGDATLDEAVVALLDGLDAVDAADQAPDAAPGTATIATRLRFGEQRLALIGMVAQFGSTDDIALADLKIELLFPADDATRAWLEAQAG